MSKFRSIGIIYSKREFKDINKIASDNGSYLKYIDSYFDLIDQLITLKPNFLFVDTLMNVNDTVINSFSKYLTNECFIKIISKKTNPDVHIAGLLHPEEYINFFLDMNKALILKERTKYKISSGEVSDFLKNIGFSTKRLGFNYMKDTIFLAINEGGKSAELKTMIYPQIARKYNCSIETIDKNISRVIESTYNMDIRRNWSCLFNTSTLNIYYPTSKEFLTLVINYLIDKNF